MTTTRKTPLAVAPTLAATIAATVDPALVRAWIETAATQYRGRADVLRAIVLAHLSPDPVNVLVVGPPGTAKTALAVEWCRATAARCLDVTLSPWTEAAELLGPVDLAALAAGRLERATSPAHPTLLDAETVVLDELPRSTSGIRAMALRVLSDRRTPTGDPVPAHVVIATANTRLTSEEDAAMVDRFALRVEAGRLMSSPDLRAVITRRVSVGGTAPTIAPLPSLPSSTIADLRALASVVDLPGDVADALTSLALALRQPAPTGASYPDVSERRWVIATRLLQASAALEGRTAIDWTDLGSVLPMVLDNGPESRPALVAAINAAVPKWVRALADLDAACTAAVARARRVGGVVDAQKGDGDAHTKREEEFDTFLAPLRPYGSDVVTRAESRIDAARDACDAAYLDGQSAYAAHRKATR